MTQANPWAAKARALDRYRWLLLRERHGLLGSALRFAREAIGDWWFSLQAKRHLAESIRTEPCDFLLLQSAPKVIKFQRKKLLIEELRARGYSLREDALQERRVILRERLLKCPPRKVPFRYFGYAAYAEWIAEHNQPRVLLNDRNGSLYSPFLRLALNRRGLLFVHLAHATTVESSRRLGMNDYDYYLLFGKSSELALRRRALRYGQSVLVLAGSHMIDDAFDMPIADSSLKTLLVLGVGPDKEKEPSYQMCYRLVRDWAASRSDYRLLVKKHPRSDARFWQEAADALPNVEVLPSSCALSEALKMASIVVNFMSNAVIEAGLSKRPVVYVSAESESDIFDQEHYFGEGVLCVEELGERIQKVEQRYLEYAALAQEFASFHLAGGFLGLHRVTAVLESLVENQKIVSDVEYRVLGPAL